MGGLKSSVQDPGLRVLSSIIIVAAVGAWWFSYLFRLVVWDLSLAIATVLFMLLVTAAGLFPMPVGPRIKATVTTAPLFLAALILPPGAATLAALVGGLAYQIGLRIKPPRLLLPWYKYPFNAGETILSTGTASWVFHSLAGNDLVTMAVAASAISMYLINTCLISLMAAIHMKLNPARVWWIGTMENGLAEVSLFAFGYLGAVGYQIKPWILLALLTPVGIIYFAFYRLADFNVRLEEALERIKGLQGELLRNAKLASLGALTLDLGHQLKNPIFIITGHLESLQRKITTEHELHSKVNEALKAAWRMNELTEAFLSMGQQRWVKLDIVGVLDEAIGISTTKLNKLVDIDRTYEVNELHIEGHPILLREALSNLVTNAIEAVPVGGKISVQLITQNGNVLINIVDNGLGIPEKQKSLIFEPFNTSKKKGLGLGLFSAKHIVEMHRGLLSVESRSGKGTRVEVALPIKVSGQDDNGSPDPAR
ncbi:MAG: HAMP domain-containing histidine kinase [Chloroflexi bacterium]|nr:HAMP domain-containing histidine kinase [Chloroflexota bacterium]